jgi:hypothetical protein
LRVTFRRGGADEEARRLREFLRARPALGLLPLETQENIPDARRQPIAGRVLERGELFKSLWDGRQGRQNDDEYSNRSVFHLTTSSLACGRRNLEKACGHCGLMCGKGLTGGRLTTSHLLCEHRPVCICGRHFNGRACHLITIAA